MPLYLVVLFESITCDSEFIICKSIICDSEKSVTYDSKLDVAITEEFDASDVHT